MRYGINPHQQARVGDGGPLRVLGGDPSYINYLDALNAWPLVQEASAALGEVVAASFKHVSPAGVATAGELDPAAREAWELDGPLSDVTSAYLRARDVDPKSSYGDVIAVSAPVDRQLAEILAGVVSDGIVAPGYEPDALALLAAKKRGSYLVLEADPAFTPPAWESRDVSGLHLEQETDAAAITPALLRVIEGKPLPPEAVRDAILGMVTLRYTQSNSVALLRDGAALGIGAGQQNRVDCVRLAGAKAAVWWARRHQSTRELPQVAEMSRQDRFNWQVRWAEGDMTASQWTQFEQLFGKVAAADGWRERHLAELDGVTLVSDGFLPFRDNIEYAQRAGVRYVVEPGGSIRSEDVATACAEFGMTLVHTGLRLFHH
ncbi:MAG: phosphoribosylaminoimidazolecarboxamide formyltransferase [Solirubrobacteraceae bacterium]